jgi:NAD(P)H dehydrogenase (quinone)
MKLAWLLWAAAAWAQQPPARILIAYHSDTGNTEKMAQAVRKGAASVAGVAVSLKKAADVKDSEITQYDGIVVGAPVHWANLAVEGRRFLDRVANAFWTAKMTGDGRMAGVFCTGGSVSSGKDMARLSTIAEFLAMRFTVIGGVDADGFGTLGPQATTGPGSPGVNAAAEEEARVFGERFARATRQFRSGTVKQ